MASHERQTVVYSPELSSALDYVYDPFFDENSSMSPNGPLSDSNFGSSPMGSEFGSTETESEDEVSLAELTRRMAEYTFQDDGDDENSEGNGGYEGYNSSSMGYDYNPGTKKAVSDSGLPKYLNASEILSLQLRNQPELKKQGVDAGGGRRGKAAEQKEYGGNMQERGKTWRSSGHGRRGCSFPSHFPSQVGGSGVRAVFLGGSKCGTGSTGTGVFLPSAPHTKAEPKRNQGCSTVLIPARVLQTLQQHFNNVGAKSQSHNSAVTTSHPWQNDVLARINGLLSQQKEEAVFKIQPAATKYDQEELRLPQEWTY